MTTCFSVIESFLLEVDGLEEQLEPISSVATAEEIKKWGLNTSVQQKTTKHKTRKKNLPDPSWVKRKNELQALRAQTKALQIQVDQLEADHASVNGRSPLKTRALVEESRRRTAQNENVLLKAKLQRYAKQSEALKNTLKTAEAEQKEFLRGAWLFVRALSVEVVGAGRQLRHCSSEVFDMLERKVDASFLEFEHFLKADQWPVLPGNDQVVETTDSSGAVEFSVTTLMPFDEKTMFSAMWSVVRTGKYPDSKGSTVILRSDDAFAVTFDVAVQLGRGDVINIDTHCVTKRFETAEGSAILTEFCCTWTANFPSSGTWTHTTQERAAFVLREYSHEGGASPGMCLGRNLVRFEPGELGKDFRHFPLKNSCTLKEVLIPSTRQLIHARKQFMENSLFDAIRSQTERSSTD